MNGAMSSARKSQQSSSLKVPPLYLEYCRYERSYIIRQKNIIVLSLEKIIAVIGNLLLYEGIECSPYLKEEHEDRQCCGKARLPCVDFEYF